MQFHCYFYAMVAKLSFLLIVVLFVCSGFRYRADIMKPSMTDSLPANAIFLADPTIFHNGSNYYLYGTGGKGNKEGGFIRH